MRARPYDRQIAQLALPAFGALVAEPLYILADTAVVGHLGTPQLGGLAVAASILLSGYAVFVFLAYGTTATVARLIGAGDERGAAHNAVQSLWLALGISVVLGVAGWVAAEPLVSLFGAEGAVATNALVYLRISLAGLPALLVTLAGTGYLRGLQDTRTPLMVALGTAVLNLVIELVLVYGFDQGIGASALATVVAQTVGGAIYVSGVVRAVRRLGVGVRPNARVVARLLRLGGALLVRTAALRGALAVATAVATRIGTADVGAHEIAFAVWSLLALALDAVAIAGQAMIGRALGAGQGDEARAAARRMIELGFGAGVVLAVLVVAVRPVVPAIFSDDPAVRHLVAFLLWWVAALQPLNGIVFVLDGVLIGAGDMRFLALAMLGAFTVFAAAAGAVGALDLGIGWLWGAIGLLMLARAVPLWWRFATDRWVVLGAGR